MSAHSWTKHTHTQVDSIYVCLMRIPGRNRVNNSNIKNNKNKHRPISNHEVEDDWCIGIDTVHSIALMRNRWKQVNCALHVKLTVVGTLFRFVANRSRREIDLFQVAPARKMRFSQVKIRLPSGPFGDVRSHKYPVVPLPLQYYRLSKFASFRVFVRYAPSHST